MKKLNKIQKIGVMILAAFMMLSTFVACNAEIEDTVSSASVTFAPGIPKALNQSGEAGSVQDKDVSVYHWQYKFAQTEEKLEEEKYKNFNDDFSTTGLGTINGLIKGKQYYFALAGYTTATNAADATLVWEGQTESAVKITAKNTTVSITVKPMGKGNVFFDITSTVSDETKFTGATLNDGEESDIYFITYAELSTNDDNTSATNTSFTDVTYSTDTDGVYMSYKTTSESGDLELAAGQYLFTIEQQKWNNGAYETVDGRGQVLIVTVEAGVKTYVKGSLDSSISTYVATNDIDVTFSDGDPDNVKSLIVTRTAESGSEAIVYDNSRIYVYDGQYVQLSFTQIDGAAENLKVYVNKYALDLTTTTTDGYYKNSQNSVTHVKPGSKANEILAYGAAGDDYIVTIRYNKQSMSFTIVGKDSTAATAKNTEAIKVTTALQDSSEYITLQTLVTTENVTIEDAKITNADAYSAADALSTGTDMTDVAERDLTLTLKVTETESTASSSTFEIGMDAELVYKDAYGQQMKALEGSLHDFDNYVEISVQIETGLEDVTVKHSENAMNSVTSTTDFTSANDTTGNGMYYYDSTSGKLYIATKSFSKFAVNFKELELQISQSGESDKYMYLSAFRDSVNSGNSYAGCTVTLLKDVDLSSFANWTPIGNSNNPFSGIFDGNDKTISGLKIVSTGMNQGLFGYVSGTANSDYDVDSIWDNTNKVLNTDCIAESKYTAVIKDLNLKEASVTVSFSGTTNDSEATGGLVGKAINTYISNIQMLSGTVKGYKQVGGVAGYIEKSIIRDCSTSNNFSVSLNDTCKYTVAGIVGTTRSENCAVINCTNNAPITGKGSTCMAGIVGQMTSGNSLIYGCVNNGDVTGSYAGTASNESDCICGIAGQNAGAKYVINCVNTGTISNTAGTYGQLSGIGGYRGGIFYNCHNSGTITGKAFYVAGISGGHSGNSNVTTVEKCSNTGTLSNSYDANKVASYIGTSATVILKDVTLPTPDSLNNAVYSLTGANLLELDNVHFSSGSTWNYSVVNSLNVKINDNCDKPAIVIGNVNNTVGIEGNGLTITIPETTTLTELKIKGNNTTLTNSGTITAGLVFGENSQNETITNLGSIDVVTIKGSSNIFNNGDSDHTSSSVSKYISCNCQNTTITNYGKIGEGANTSGYNVLNFDSASGSVVNNYGIIYGRGNNANYAIGMKASTPVTFNLYSGSKLIKRDGGWIIRSGSTDMTLNINWAAGTIFTSESGEALDEAAVNAIDSVYESGTTAILTITPNKID